MRTVLPALLTGAFMLINPAGLGAASSESIPAFWVSPNGSDTAPGTREHPLASIALAQRKARELRRLDDPAAREGVRIVLTDGTFRLDAPLFFRAEDSGTAPGPTRIEAAPGASPVISGGVAVQRWRRLSESVPGLPRVARRNVWVADAPRVGNHTLYFRHLWVNGRPATRARTPNGDQMDRLLEWDRTQQQAWISRRTLVGLQRPADVEMVIQQQWEIAICRLKSLDFDGNRVRVGFHKPEGPIQFEHPWPQPVMSTNGNAPFYLVNALEFLDHPGEWFQEYPSGRVYYWPLPGEDPARAEIIAPVLETLLELRGTADHPVSHLSFHGIRFSNTTWMRPSFQGHVPLQAGMFLLDAYKLSPKGTRDHSAGLDNQAWIGRPPGAVTARHAHHVRFERCRFEHLAFAGLDLNEGTREFSVEGCVVRDAGGNGIQAGIFADPAVETHRPFNPSDERILPTRLRIANNLVTDCGRDDWGSVGILVGYSREVSISNNELHDLPYTGISMGWGWNKAANCMRDNRIVANHIHRVATRMCDTGGIYTLSPQPGTLIASNAVHDIRMSPYVSDPEHWFYLYLDEGSSHITVRDNWCPEERFLKNANGPGNVWENNGPGVSDLIRANAGLQTGFRDLLN